MYRNRRHLHPLSYEGGTGLIKTGLLPVSCRLHAYDVYIQGAGRLGLIAAASPCIGRSLSNGHPVRVACYLHILSHRHHGMLQSCICHGRKSFSGMGCALLNSLSEKETVWLRFCMRHKPIRKVCTNQTVTRRYREQFSDSSIYITEFLQWPK